MEFCVGELCKGMLQLETFQKNAYRLVQSTYENVKLKAKGQLGAVKKAASKAKEADKAAKKEQRKKERHLK